MHVAHYESPIGTLEIKEETGHIMWLSFSVSEPGSEDDSPVIRDCKQQLEAYFTGKLRSFDLPLATGGSPFQQKVWDETRRIPYGKTASYLDIATRMGDSHSSRAVGLANSKNPILMIIPCHRVVGANGSLTGYAGGLRRKQWLLELENAQTSLF